VLSVSVPEGMTGWPIKLRHPGNREDVLARFELTEGAISGSGNQKGQHIIDVRSVEGVPVEGRLAAWAMAPDAVAADALSTAFMMLSAGDIDDYCLANPGTAAIIVPHVGSEKSSGRVVESFGQRLGFELST